MTADRDLHTLGARSLSPYEWRDQDDDASNEARKLEALRGAVRSLAKRVGALEAALDLLKNGAPGKTPRRQAPAVPVRRPARARAPTGGETMLHRRGKLKVR
jgi:hypothetical protein